MTDRIDHAAEAVALLNLAAAAQHRGDPRHLIAAAQVHASLALVEQQRALFAEVCRLRAMETRVLEYARHLALPFADGVPDREGEQIASELLAALDGGER